MCALSYSKNSQFFHAPSVGYYEQFESLMNFKRDLNLLEKSDKFSKFPS
jgi:hypothetical protein